MEKNSEEIKVRQPDSSNGISGNNLPLSDPKKIYEEDPITGSYNMYAFLQHVEAVRKEQSADELKKSSIIYFNISTFRIYNDTFGIEQGNICLKQISDIIRSVFGTNLTSRFYADHFLVYYTKEDYPKKITACHESVQSLKKSFHLWLKAGVVHPTDGLSLSAWCDNARIACDAITLKGLDYYRVYTQKLSNDLIKKKYIQDNIDAAILHGNILIYYQPVIRTLSGKVCGAEALARWDDPVYGFLSPDTFVPALEERHLSYKLDQFVAERVCQDLHRRVSRGLPVVPVSINFSSRDFAACDPLQVLETAVRRYDLDRDCIHIEITESAVMEDPDTVRDLIGRFHRTGYEVWMDDFGSAYSSLNALSRFEFDQLKLDMVFMRNFSDRTKKILRQIINMSKELNIHTLAEGVETREQLDFLREAGCEKIQGFYYGRPLPLEQQMQHLQERGLPLESIPERIAYDRLGLNVFPADRMFLILSYRENEKRFHIIYPSSEIRKRFSVQGQLMTIEELEASANSDQTAAGISLRNAAFKSVQSGEKISSFVAIGFNNYRFDIRCITKIRDRSLLWMDCTDITGNTVVGSNTRYAGILRNITNAYHTVYRVDMKDRLLEVIRSFLPGEKTGDIIRTIPDPALMDHIYWDDRQRFLNEAKEQFIRQQLEKSRSGYYTLIFRMKTAHGDYRWTEAMIIGIFLNGSTEYLFCLKDLSPADPVILHILQDSGYMQSLTARFGDLQADEASDSGVDSALFRPESLWSSLVHQAKIEFFWKDIHSRIVGASDSYFANRQISPADVIGRTDHELGWHVNDAESLQADEEILQHGRVLYEQPEEITMNGTVHHILSSRFPIYENGDIRGIMGYTTPAEKYVLEDQKNGVLSGLDFLHAYSIYEQNYVLNGEDYGLAVIYIPVCHDIGHTYGKETAAALANRIYGLALQDLEKNSVICPFTADIFVILSRSPDLAEEVHLWCAHMGEIRSVSGHSCSVRGFSGITRRNQVKTPYQMYGAAFSLLAMSDGSYETLSVEMLRVRLADYRKIFDIVQLIDPRRRKRMSLGSVSYADDTKNCWEAMHGTGRCLNCLAAEALRTRKKVMNLKIFGNLFFVVYAFYIELDGTPCVIECAQHLDEKLLDQIGSRNEIANQLSRLNYEVYTDRLTNTRNRRFYDEQLADSTADAVAFIDIDNFKHFNDAYGHHAGDLVLQRFAQAVLNVLKPGEHLIRYGGDEFVVVYETMPNRDELHRSLEQVQENIVNIRINEPGLQNIRCSASIGAVCKRGIVKDMTLIADHELYRAKTTKKGSIRVSCDTDTSISDT